MGDKNKIPKIETKLEVKNENEEVADLYLYGPIREAYWWDDEDDVISAKRVRKVLDELKGKDVNVHLNSGGGDVFESIAIANTLKQHDGDIHIIIDSLAGSGASVIAAAGKKVTMFSNSMQMIHKAWTFASGNADELRKIADDLDKIDSAVKASYKERFVGTDEELEDLIKTESWLNAEECLAFGFADEIFIEEEKEGEVENNIKETLFNKYGKSIQNKNDKKKVGEKAPTLFNAFMKNKNEGEDK